MRSRFIVIGIAVLVPLVVLMLQLAQYERDNALANAEERVKLLASLTADRQQGLVQRTEITLTHLANAWQARAGDMGCSEFLAAARAGRPWMAGLRVSALDGTAVCADGPEVLEQDVLERSYFTAVLAGEAFAVSDHLVSRGAGKPIIVAAVPIADDARLLGVLHAALELEALGDLLPAELRNGNNLIVDVIDRNGVVLARHPHVPELIGRPASDTPVVQRALQQPSGTAELSDLTGAQRLFAFHVIDGAGWVVAVGIDRASVVGPIDAALHKRLALIAAIIVVSCLIGLIGGEAFVFRPLRELAGTARALERGDYGARPRLTGLSEVGALERALSAMAEAIDQRETDLKASQAAREHAVREATRANQAKSHFLASMSHEIRTPLGGIVGYSELLLGQDLAPKPRRYAERLEAAAAAAISVIDGILDVARIEAGEVEIDQRPFSLPALIDNTISIVGPSAQGKGLDLDVERDPELPAAVLGDEIRLRQVLLNLLSNAIKFTARGGVTLQVRRGEAGERIRFAVTDTGIGIAEAQHHRLFRRFSQAHDANRGYGGTGLGLAICKELVGLMGGEFGFDSKPGQGSTFWIELALPQADAATVEASSVPEMSPETGRILVADDFEMSQEITSSMLTMAGHEVDVVGDGAQAVEALRHKVYDLVLMDIEMRGMNGMEAVRRIRRLDAPARHVPVIALTANVLPQQVREFKSAGMDDHLGKPFTRDQLIAKVNQFLLPAAAGGAAYAISPPAPGDDDQPVAEYDHKALAEMKVLLGDQRTAAWLAMLRQQLVAMLSVDDKLVNRDQLAGAAHALVSQAGMAGFRRLSQLASDLEDACIQPGSYSARLDLVKEACQDAVRRLDQI